MSVLTFKEIHNGRDGDDDGKARRYTRVFRATTSSNSDDAAVVLLSAPAYGAVYPADMAARCQRRGARNESFSKRIWIVTCNYSTERELQENPLQDAAEITWETDSGQKPVAKDRDGKAYLNSAGDPFDPPAMMDDSDWVANIQKNVAQVPAWFRTYKDAVNSDAFTLDGLDVEIGEAKLSNIRLGRWEERNDIRYRSLSMSIGIKEVDVANKKYGWMIETQDAGFHKKDPTDATKRVKITLADGSEPTAPVLLDGSGAVLANPSLDNAEFVRCNAYNAQPFSILPLA